MTSPIAVLKSDWQHFKADPPGQRFVRQRERANRRSRAQTILFLVLGLVMVAGGIVLLVFPGPGIPLIVLGLALIASVSQRLARVLDRAEPALRRRWAAIKRWWKQRRRS